jgi:Family of unknown function (DUF6527)
MKAQPYKRTEIGKYQTCSPSEATHVEVSVPGPYTTRWIHVGPKTELDPYAWTWNQDTERPTFSPSFLVRGQFGVCHSFITDGTIDFLSDCEHEFKGQKHELLELTPIDTNPEPDMS